MRTILLFVIIFGLIFSASGFAQTESELQRLIQESKTRAALVERVQKAVVHIKVEKVIESGSRGSLNNPFDFYGDEFFERFFPGIRPPRNNNRNPERDREFRQEGMGSGSIIDTRGYILTNHHVVGEADTIKVLMFDGREFEAKLVGTDPESDISVIQIQGDDLPVLATGNSDDIKVGESVFAVGNPFGLSHSVTFGIVSAKGRSNIGITEYEDFIQTDAAINPGNSGGPLISLEGKIVGVNTAIYTRSGGYQGIGFAVPINMARSIMEDLIEKGSVSRGWLGVGIQDVTPDLARAFRLKDTKGTLITGVMPNTPAEKAGLKKGDVITHLNSKMIDNSNELRNSIANAKALAKVQIDYIRDGRAYNVAVTLDERPKETNSLRFQDDPQEEEEIVQSNQLGFGVQELTRELSERLGYDTRSKGIVITEVEPDSSASSAGLRAGMMIVEINRTNVQSIKEFNRLAQNVDLKEGVLLLVRTPQGSQYVFLQNK